MSSSPLSLGSKSPVLKSKRKRDPSSDSSSSSEACGAEDVPVLSHAAKRKERKAVSKKALPTDTPAKKEKKEEGHDPRPLKRENSIWVGNLCYKTTPESLRRFFDGVGEITRVHLPTKLGKASPGGDPPARRENRGCAFFPLPLLSHSSQSVFA